MGFDRMSVAMSMIVHFIDTQFHKYMSMKL
jgi:hypothetical protein